MFVAYNATKQNPRSTRSTVHRAAIGRGLGESWVHRVATVAVATTVAVIVDRVATERGVGLPFVRRVASSVSCHIAIVQFSCKLTLQGTRQIIETNGRSARKGETRPPHSLTFESLRHRVLFRTSSRSSFARPFVRREHEWRIRRDRARHRPEGMHSLGYAIRQR